MIRTVRVMGDPVLTEEALEVRDIHHPSVKTLVADMWDTMADEGGIGIAAPQVGVPLRIICFGLDEAQSTDRPAVPRTVLINPKVEFLTDETEEGWEGCLSVPGMRGSVPRCTRIRYTGFDLEGRPIDRIAQGFHARVVQHEFDHLCGKLYPMRVKDWTKFGFTRALFPPKDEPGE